VLLRYGGMGVELAAAVIGLTLLGLWIDSRFKTGPTGVLVGAGLGIVGGFYNFLRAALQLSREQDAREGREPRHRNDDDDQRV
jgi:F0F1-type ATP synthase assembly protein I